MSYSHARQVVRTSSSTTVYLTACMSTTILARKMSNQSLLLFNVPTVKVVAESCAFTSKLAAYGGTLPSLQFLIDHN